MLGPRVVLFLCVLAAGNSINRPVVKIVLNQKGYAQFIQYDVETPPLREFTLCAWIRLHDLAGDQSIFTYVGSGSTRIIRVWLDSGGRLLRVSIDARAASSTAVEFATDAWRHVCLSYQSDYGAWALYIDSRLVFCQTSQKLLGFIVPGGGSLILGYGTSEKGSPNGLEGEIYGACMILLSTIERNYTLKIDPRYEQKTFRKNRIRGKNKQDNRYIVLSDLQTDEIRTTSHGTSIPVRFNKTRNLHLTTPHTLNDHNIGIELISEPFKQSSSSSESEILDMSEMDNFKSNEKGGVSFWNLVNKNQKSQQNESKIELTESGTQDLVTVFEYETPPSVTAPKIDYSDKGQRSMDVVKHNNNNNKMSNNKFVDAISDVEKPPPPEEKTQVYGQWTNSKFVGNVLKYLKSINFNKNRDLKKVPSTIPLVKLSDSFPYASEFKHTKIRPPLKFNRKQFSKKRHTLKKRDANKPQINLQIIESDIRSDILKLHSETQAKQVEVTNRGEAKYEEDKRYYRNAESYSESLESIKTSQNLPKLFAGQPFTVVSNRNNQKILSSLERHRSKNLMAILPFLKSVEYFMHEGNNDTTENNLMYSKSFANANKWHNVKSYNNDYTPRRIDLEVDGKSGIDVKIAEVNKKNPSIRYKYNHHENKLVNIKNDVTIEKGRALAEEVSNQANENQDSISILKYNHGFLPGHKKRKKVSDKINNHLTNQNRTKKRKNNFNKHVKLGNALNEQHIIGLNQEQNKLSFVGGNDDIPDINRYRSDWDNELENIPSSLGPKVCKNIELYDRVMYVQPDGSIDMTHILSPVRKKNLGIEFIIQNYKKCSMQDSTLQKHPYLLIDWSKTPVKLFGGAYPKKTKDLCGFF